MHRCGNRVRNFLCAAYVRRAVVESLRSIDRATTIARTQCPRDASLDTLMYAAPPD